MKKELVVSVRNNEVHIALLEDGVLMQMHIEPLENNFNVGDIYLGKIKKLAPSLNAAFVDIGYSKDAFLHYHDLGPYLNSTKKFVSLTREKKIKGENLNRFKLEPLIDKNGTIDQVLKAGEPHLVQIIKEPISTKGPRIASELSIAGRYLILTPFNNKVSVSQKIASAEEKNRLSTLVESIKPQNFGIIVRTAAEGKKVAELHADVSYLEGKWKQISKNIHKKPPTRVLVEMDRASSILRDNFDEHFSSILVDDEDMAEEMKNYLKIIAPEQQKIVKVYQNKATPLFQYKGVEKQIKQSFGRHANVTHATGAYLIIEHTEALHVIDVNSGTIGKKQKNQEETALQINKLAAAEVARQLRLRDMGGIVVVDFIDMRQSKNRKELYEYLKAEMSKDTAKFKILPPSKFGLIQITRERVRPEINIETMEENPNKDGKVEAPILLVDTIEHRLQNLIEKKEKEFKKVSLHTHPFIAAYLTKGFPSIRMKWYQKYKKWIKIVPRDNYKYLQYNFLDKDNNTLFNDSN